MISNIEKTDSSVCGIGNAPPPNTRHKVFLGDCMTPLICIKNKCTRGVNRIQIFKSIKKFKHFM